MVCCGTQLGVELVGKAGVEPVKKYSSFPLVIPTIYVNLSDSAMNINTLFSIGRHHVSVSIARSRFSPL